ncbi:MAG: GerMN domain-containing protein [Acidimicrobiia bacterium]|nr:GerMN domain-containing protein [Acidimicrobiia bacterium]
MSRPGKASRRTGSWPGWPPSTGRVEELTPARVPARSLVLALALVALVLASCGVRSQSSPTRLDRESAPADLMERPTTTTAAQDGSRLVPVYLVAKSGLVLVRRPVEATPTPERRLAALLEGPTPPERTLGLTTAIPRGGDVTARRRDRSTVEVRLDPAFGEGAIPDQATAFAQVVYTLTADGQVRRVVFLLDGEPVAIPRPDGSLTSGAVTRSDFAGLAPD